MTGMDTRKRPYGILHAIGYAVSAAVAHYRFARTPHHRDNVELVVVSRRPSQDRMDDVGCRWSDWSRMQGAQPTDPAVIWEDVATLWAAYHRASQDARRLAPLSSTVSEDHR